MNGYLVMTEYIILYNNINTVKQKMNMERKICCIELINISHRKKYL